MQTVPTQRNDSLDLLRVPAAFAVVMIHSVTRFQHLLMPQSGWEWMVGLLYETCSRFAVPIFVMISGAVFLMPGRFFSYRDILTKRIPRLCVSFLFWAVLYAFLYYRHYLEPDDFHGVKEFLWAILSGHYHLWFLLMLIPLYLAIPVFHKLLSDQKLSLWFLGCWFVLTILMQSIREIPWTNRFYLILEDKLSLSMFTNYSGYFLLGGYLSRYPLSKRMEKWVYGAGALGVLIAYGCSCLFTRLLGEWLTFSSPLTLGVFFYSVAIFVLFTQRVKVQSHRLLTSLSGCSFGIYLLHPLVLDHLVSAGIFNGLAPCLSILLAALLSFLIAYCIIFLLRKVKWCRSWIC